MSKATFVHQSKNLGQKYTFKMIDCTV